MKFSCDCGAPIRDQSDALPHKATLLRDQSTDQLWDDVEELCRSFAEACRQGTRRSWIRSGLSSGVVVSDDALADRIQALFTKATTSVYECADCMRLLIEDARGQLQSYFPEDSDQGTVLNSHPPIEP